MMPKKIVDKKLFENLCGIQCTREEIQQVMDLSKQTIEKFCKETYNKKFGEVFEQFRTSGKASLRRAQWNKAINKLDTSMLIWLGKNILGQTDKMTNELVSEIPKMNIQILGKNE